MSEPLTYTVEEAAELCGVSRAVAYSAVHAGELPSVRLGRRILVPRARLLALLGELPVSKDSEGGESIEEVNSPDASVSANGRGDATAALDS
jgi:excisionase family DNA binding protein